MNRKIMAVMLAAAIAAPTLVPVNTFASDASSGLPVLVDLSFESDDAVRITWEKAEGATGYNIYRKRAGENWVQVGSAEASDTTFVHEASADLPLEDGSTYSYTVRAVNGETLGKMDVTGLAITVGEVYSPLEEELYSVVDEFIARVSTPDMDREQKLKACWNHFMGNDFIPSMEPDVDQDGWQYQAAIDYISMDAGECAMLACATAACAKRLGYDPVYVYHIPYDHSFVIAEDTYWDNMNSSAPMDHASRDYNDSEIFLY